jgi:O-acetylhomoserine (thiol)-lyase
MFAVNFRKLGIEATMVDPDDPENFRRALKPNTKAIFSETLGNPAINMVDIDAVGAIAREAGIPLHRRQHRGLAVPLPAVRRTARTSSCIRRPNTSAGTARPWVASWSRAASSPGTTASFPSMTEPSSGYHGVRFFETFGDFAFTMKARME